MNLLPSFDLDLDDLDCGEDDLCRCLKVGESCCRARRFKPSSMGSLVWIYIHS